MLGLIGGYQHLGAGMIMRTEKGQRGEGTVGHHPSSFQILSFFLSPQLPKQSHSHLSLLFLLSLISCRHCFKPVPFRCFRPSSSLSDWFVNTRLRDPRPLRRVGFIPHSTKKNKSDWRCGSRDANVVLSGFCYVSSCEMNVFWRQPYPGIIQGYTLWPYAASCVFVRSDRCCREPSGPVAGILMKMPTWM